VGEVKVLAQLVDVGELKVCCADIAFVDPIDHQCLSPAVVVPVLDAHMPGEVARLAAELATEVALMLHVNIF